MVVYSTASNSPSTLMVFNKSVIFFSSAITHYHLRITSITGTLIRSVSYTFSVHLFVRCLSRTIQSCSLVRFAAADVFSNFTFTTINNTRKSGGRDSPVSVFSSFFFFRTGTQTTHKSLLKTRDHRRQQARPPVSVQFRCTTIIYESARRQ